MEMKVDLHKVIQSDCKTQEVRSTIPMRVRLSKACVSSVGSQDFEPAARAGFSQLRIDTIEINLCVLTILFYAERHCDKGMRFHTTLYSIDSLNLAISRHGGCLVICLLFVFEHLRDVGLDLFMAEFLNSSHEGRIGLNMCLVGIGSAQL